MSNNDCKEVWENEEESLSEVTDVSTFLSEGVLEIKRVQTLSNGWITDSYILVLGIGGPHVEINTSTGLLSVFWWSDTYESRTYDSKVVSLLEVVEEYLNEIYESDQ